MSRCHFTVLSFALAAACFSAPAQAQMQRKFPQNALRGEMAFLTPPNVVLNGQQVRLAPGTRIRGVTNMLEMSGSLEGKEGTVNYTVDMSGELVKDVWILTPEEEANKPWPTTFEEAKTWTFDPVSQRWSKP